LSMSHFIDNQAEESDHDDSDASSIGAPAAKRSKKQKKRQISDDEDEGSEDEDARIQEELGDFVVDEVDEAEDVDDDDDDNVETKSKGESEVSELMDDELELINENIGRKVGGRVQLDSDDEDDDRTRVQNDLFGYGEEDDLGGSGGRNYETASIRSRSDSERSEDRFIVDDNEPEGGHGRRRKKQRKRGGFDDQILDEAKEVFGVDNIDEFYDEEEFPEEEMDDDEQRVVQQRPAKTTLLSAMEPSELDKGYMTSFDKGVTFLDKPERFQLRRVPVTEIEEDLLPTEVLWIFQYAFESSPLSKQDVKRFDNDKLRQLMQNGIRETLLFIRNQLFEVPFIAFYRKESIESLKISDLWKIYTYDEKFCLLEQRKRRLVELIERMDAYLKNSSEHENQPIVRPISYADKDSVRMVSTMEDFVDVNARFQLYYGNEITRMCEWEKISGKSDLIDVATKFKQSGRSDKYLLCMQCGLSGMAQLFGLDAEKFAENYSDYMKNDWTSHPVEPLVAAESFRCDNFPTEEDVLQGATYLLATQISRQPGVRRKLRERYRRKLNISVHPTKRGRDQIDRNSPLWPRRYIKDKPVSYLEGDEYLVYMQAKKNGLVEVKLYCDTDREREGNRTLLDSIETELYQKEDYAEVAQEWNKHRREAMRLCVNDFLMPVLEREAHERLLEEAQEFVLKSISQKVMERVAQAPYTKEFTYANEDEEEEGVRIMGVVYSSDPNEAAFAVVIDENGGVVDHQRFPHLYKRISRNDPHSLKRRELDNLRDFIVKTNPHVIAMAGEDLEAIRLQTDISALIRQMKEDNEIPYQIPVEIVACDIAKVYMNSRMAVEELPSYPPVLRQSVALARCLLDPLVEFCHLCNTEDDILFVKFHPLQEEVAKQDLLTAIHRELINRVNEVGVDINRCLEFPHTAGMLQFVCGLGPRKAAQLLKVLKQNDNLLESRTKLVTFCRMGPKVFMNAAGFIKIDTVKVSERSEADAYVEVLDGSRVHPETYEWARKMAVDALEIDDLETEPSTALEEILSAPERLKDLDLDAFADELERQNFGNKSITLYDIRAELNSRYKDQRAPYKSPDGPALIDMLVPDISAFRTGSFTFDSFPTSPMV
jgi:transcription elongation factor SPT6